MLGVFQWKEWELFMFCRKGGIVGCLCSLHITVWSCNSSPVSYLSESRLDFWPFGFYLNINLLKLNLKTFITTFRLDSGPKESTQNKFMMAVHRVAKLQKLKIISFSTWLMPSKACPHSVILPSVIIRLRQQSRSGNNINPRQCSPGSVPLPPMVIHITWTWTWTWSFTSLGLGLGHSYYLDRTFWEFQRKLDLSQIISSLN